MQHAKEDIFATTITRFKFNDDEIKPLLDEIIEKKQQIKDTSSFYNDSISGNYFTDFKNPTKLREYEVLMNTIKLQYNSNNLLFNVSSYWTAIYGKGSRHNPHNHQSVFNNYSSIFYLTNNGETSFLSPNHTAEYSYYYEKAEVGKVVIFPSALWHFVEYKDLGERIIISSNIKITGN
tara:strand:- start:84 stop:617 length:534 start_codon:yes stop_codon:yes gene_type:complete